MRSGQLSVRHADKGGDDHVHGGIAHGGGVAAGRAGKRHEQAVEYETRKPDDKVGNVQRFAAAVPVKDEVVRGLDGYHGREHGADEVEKARDVVHGPYHGRRGAHGRHRQSGVFAVYPCRNRLTGYAGGESVQKRGGDGGEDQNDQCRDAKPGLGHDLRHIGFAGVNGRAHADEVHPAGGKAVGQGARRRGRRGVLGVPGIVADERQPGHGHGHRQLHRRAEGESLRRSRSRGTAAEEDDPAQQNGQNEQRRHGQVVDDAQVGDADHDPEEDQPADHETPDPGAGVGDPVGRQRAVINHDGGPAHQLHDVQQGKQQPAPPAEAHFHRFHGAAARAGADHALQKEECAADDVARQNGRQAPGHAQRREAGAGQNLRQRDARAEPDEAVLKRGGLFHCSASPQ